jgi:uncharacterized protein YjbJ (UPF0337 family)
MLHAHPSHDRGTSAPVDRFLPVHPKKEQSMDRDRIKGMGDQAKGSMKDAAGKVTGDSKLQAEGKMDRAKGKVENAVGGMKDSLRRDDMDED